MRVAGLGDGPSALGVAGGMLRRNKSKVGHEPRRVSKATDVVDLAQERQGSKRLDASEAAEGLNLRSVGHGTSGLFEFGVEGADLLLEILEVFKVDREGRLEMTLERCAKLPKPEEMLLCPCGLRPVEDVAVVAQRAGDAVLGGSDLGVVTSPEPQESPQGLMFLCGDVNGGEVTATVELGKHDGVESIRLAVIAGSAGNQGRSNDVAVKTSNGERSLEDEPGTRSLVAGSDRGLLGQADKELTDLHQIGRELENLGLIGAVSKDGGGDGLVVDIETDKCYITHGWTPF
jgi:hypothetical protein